MKPDAAQSHAELSEEQATEIGTEVFIFGYPLVTMEVTRRVTTNTADPAGLRGPMGQFAHAREFPPVTYRDIPGANADTLYSVAWLDLGKEPYILNLPDAEGRYFMMPMLNGWTEVFEAPGTRTTGTKAQTYAITGPTWKGELPKGATQYQSATNIVWILGRIYTTGTAQDYEKVHSFQDKVSLVPLSAYGNDYTPPKGKVDPDIDMKTSTTNQVAKMDAAAYFKLLATLMKDNPPTDADAPMVAQMAKIGLVPGNDWDISALAPTVANGLAQAPKAALAKIMAYAPNAGRIVNGWLITLPSGVYGTNYLHRALLNLQGPGWNRPEDAVYPMARVDGEGKALNGANKYVLHFAKGELPNAKGFWSLTMYDSEGFFVTNPLDRVNLSQRSNFNINKDGSLDLYIQKDSPGKDKEANWLPSPNGAFALFMRLYWPNDKAPSIIDGSWMPPGVRAIGQSQVGLGIATPRRLAAEPSAATDRSRITVSRVIRFLQRPRRVSLSSYPMTVLLLSTRRRARAGARRGDVLLDALLHAKVRSDLRSGPPTQRSHSASSGSPNDYLRDGSPMSKRG